MAASTGNFVLAMVAAGLVCSCGGGPRSAAPVASKCEPAGATERRPSLVHRRGQDYKVAADELRERCDCRDGRACAELAYGHVWARGVPLHEDEAIALAKTACDLGDGPGCTLYSQATSATPKGRWNPQNALGKRAEQLSAAACDGGDHWACVARFKFLWWRKDYDAVLDLLPRIDAACTAGIDNACEQFTTAASKFIRAYFESKCGTSDPAELMRKLNANECELPVDDPLGNRLRKNRTRSAELMALWCDRGAGSGCAEDIPMHKTVALCRAGDYNACEDAALAADDDKAEPALLERACQGNLARSCHAAAWALRDRTNATAANRRRARRLFEKACKLGLKESCELAADAHLGGGCRALPLVGKNERHGNVPFRFSGFTGRAKSADVTFAAGARSKVLVVYVTASFERLYAQDLKTLNAVAARLTGEPVELVVLQSGTSTGFMPTLSHVKVLDDPTTGDDAIGPQSRALGTKYIPETYFVDRAGMVVHYAQGTRALHRGHLERCVRSLVAN